MAVVNRNPTIEFVVKPKEDLHLEGSLRKIPRVNKGMLFFIYVNKLYINELCNLKVMLIRVKCKKIRILVVCFVTMQSIMDYVKMVKFCIYLYSIMLL